ncbi:hypothetical protein MNBD_PLANCTO03-1645 [hydrothermal vent metagenome]|uniref:DUF4230 domain-containing protein n=1 Tax=hydrothermal vent metagenome TaxID=652676 RepID=A0A3B1DUM1_9ZZZZ
MIEILALVGGTVVCVTAGVLLAMVWIARRSNAEPTKIDVHGVAERVRATGSLVGLEVAAKEIATATKGWGWLPPIVMSQARLAMIFQFEKQYAVDLGLLRAEDVERVGAGRYRITLPAVQGKLRLVDVSPYDIQAGRVLGLLDVIPMSAERQKELMKAAQEQAGELLAASEASYLRQARASVERQLRSLLGLFDLELEIVWREGETRDSAMQVPVNLKPEVVTKPKLSLVAG